jgi:hypothetical protein
VPARLAPSTIEAPSGMEGAALRHEDHGVDQVALLPFPVGPVLPWSESTTVDS